MTTVLHKTEIALLKRSLSGGR